MIDWSAASAIVATVVSVLGFMWGVITYREKSAEGDRPPNEQEKAEDRIKVLEAWRVEVTSSIENLRREIEHVREISDIKDEATNERLRRMEDKLDELLDLLISLVKERA
jgi:hypothetical protein